MSRGTLFDSLALDWKKTQTECLQVCRHALDVGDRDVFQTAFSEIFRKYGKTVSLSEWASFFKNIHALCEPHLAVQPSNPVAITQVDSQPRLQLAWFNAAYHP